MILRVNSFNDYNDQYESSSFKQQQKRLQKPSSSPLLLKQPNRTQRKLLLQRQSFLADDKNYLDHPTNMKRLTKELEHVNKEYISIRQFEDPLHESLKRLVTRSICSSSNVSISSSSSSSSSSFSSFSSTTSSPFSTHILSSSSPVIRIHHKILLNKLQQ